MRINKKTFIEALKGSNGILMEVSRRLKVTRQAVFLFIQKNPWAKEMTSQERERSIDYAESKLHEHIEKGNPKMIKWFLATQGKHRGYTEKQEIEHTGDGLSYKPIQVNIDIRECELIENKSEIRRILPNDEEIVSLESKSNKKLNDNDS